MNVVATLLPHDVLVVLGLIIALAIWHTEGAFVFSVSSGCYFGTRFTVLQSRTKRHRISGEAS